MMNRRAFLRQSAALSAAAAGLGAATEPSEVPQRIRCGILGIDHAHGLDVLEVLRAAPDYEFVGVCEPDLSVRTKFEGMKELEGIRWLDRDELLRDEMVQLVAVESGVQRLLNLGRAVVDAGKHLHLDKPPGTSIDEFRSLMDEAERRSLIVQMGYMFRYNPGFDFVRTALQAGWLGRIYYVHASMCTDLGPDKRARAAFHPGGLMLELGCHLIDMIVLLLGVPRKVTPFLRHDGDAADGLADNTLAVLEYDRAMAVVETAAMETGAFPARRFKICGADGSIILEPLEPAAARLSLRQPKEEFPVGTQKIQFADVPRHVRDFDDMAQCIRGEKPFSYSKKHDIAVQECVLRACGRNG